MAGFGIKFLTINFSKSVLFEGIFHLIRRFAPPSPQGEGEKARHASHRLTYKTPYLVFCATTLAATKSCSRAEPRKKLEGAESERCEVEWETDVLLLLSSGKQGERFFRLLLEEKLSAEQTDEVMFETQINVVLTLQFLLKIPTRAKGRYI